MPRWNLARARVRREMPRERASLRSWEEGRGPGWGGGLRQGMASSSWDLRKGAGGLGGGMEGEDGEGAGGSELEEGVEKASDDGGVGAVFEAEEGGEGVENDEACVVDIGKGFQ